VASASGCSKGKSEQDAPKPTALITAAPVEQSRVEEQVVAYGQAETAPQGSMTLTAPMEAVVAEVLAAPGQAVCSGQAILVLSPSPQAKIDLAKARADGETTRQAYDRALRLRRSGLVGDAEVETAHSAAVAAEATYKSLSSRAEAMSAVRAPADGVVEALSANRGDQVAAGAALGRIGARNAVRIRLNMDVFNEARVTQGASVRVRRISGEDLGLGKVIALSPRPDPQTHLASAYVTAPVPLVPGEEMEGRVVIAAVSGPTVPRQALVTDDDGASVFVIDKGVAHKRSVKVGPIMDDAAAILSGLKVGERVAVEGAAALDDGMAVNEAKKPAQAEDKARGGSEP
jgi:RND family efflux transporter MFP subunit